MVLLVVAVVPLLLVPWTISSGTAITSMWYDVRASRKSKMPAPCGEVSSELIVLTSYRWSRTRPANATPNRPRGVLVALQILAATAPCRPSLVIGSMHWNPPSTRYAALLQRSRAARCFSAAVRASSSCTTKSVKK